MSKKIQMEKDIEQILTKKGINQYILAYAMENNPDKITIEGTRNQEFELYTFLYLMKRLVSNLKIL